MVENVRRAIFGLLGLYLSFVFINVNPALAQAFLFITLVDFGLLITDKTVSIPFERSTKGRILATIIGLGSWIGFTYLSVIVLAITQLAVTATFQSVISLQAQIQPFFQGSKIFEFLTFAIAIPIVETNFFFGTLYELLKDLLRIPIEIKDIRTHLLMLGISALWVWFHITAKSSALQQGIEQFSAALAIVFVFGYASLLLVTYFKQTREAVALHIFANGAAMLRKFGML